MTRVLNRLDPAQGPPEASCASSGGFFVCRKIESTIWNTVGGTIYLKAYFKTILKNRIDLCRSFIAPLAMAHQQREYIQYRTSRAGNAAGGGALIRSAYLSTYLSQAFFVFLILASK